MNAQYWDNELIDQQYRLAMNRVFLDTDMPIAVSGSDKVDSDGNVTSVKSFHKDNAPAYFKPFEKLNKLKTARIYHTEKKLKEGEPKDHHHPDGWGHETHYDPHTKSHRTFEYQDHHVLDS